MSVEQCEEKLKDKGVRPTAARILILRKLSELTCPVSLFELEAQFGTLDKSTISRTLSVLVEHHAIHSFEDGSGSMKYAGVRPILATLVTDIYISIVKYATKRSV